ncbi:MAG: tetratricopeptide repeat protein [Sedimenticola sp.]
MTEKLPPLHGIAAYNPSLLDPDELKCYFVARHPLLKVMVEGLRREQPGKTPQHRLIVGTRGMGKTTLLHRFALAVKEDPSLASIWLPLTFPEEQYNISQLSDLWVNCLDALSDSLKKMGEVTLSNELNEYVDALPQAEEARAAKALWVLLSYSQRLDRRLLLLVDNLDIVLDRLAEFHSVIREVLDHEPRLLLIGARLQGLKVTIEYDAAFSDFFTIHELEELSEEEVKEFLGRLAEWGNNAGVTRMIAENSVRLRTLYTLTGGNLRTAVLLYGVLAQGIDGDVRSDFERLLDHCTPLYKARFEELSHQAQKVVDAMAIYWDPLTAGGLAKLVRLPVNTVSTQLTRLERQGVVEKVDLRPGRKHGFQIAERFFNIWYLMRTSGRVRRRLIWLVQFLQVFYSQDESRERTRSQPQNGVAGKGDSSLRHSGVAAPRARVIDDGPPESSALQIMMSDRQLRKALEGMIDFDGDDARLAARPEMIAFIKELPKMIASSRPNWPKEVDVGQLIKRLVELPIMSQVHKQQILSVLPSMSDDSLVKLDSILRTSVSELNAAFLLDSPLPKALKKAVHDGLIDTIYDVDGLRVAAEFYQQPALDVLANLEELRRRDRKFSVAELKDLMGQVKKYGVNYQWDNLANAMEEQGNPTTAIEAYRELLKVKPDHEDAWNNMAIALEKQGDWASAIKAYRKQVEVKPDHEYAWNNMAIALEEQRDWASAIEAYRELLKVKPDHEDAWNNMAIALEKQGDWASAIKAYRKQVEVKPDHEYARDNLIIALEKQRDWASAIEAYRELLKVKPDHKDAWNNMAGVLEKQGNLMAAIEAYRKQVEVKPDHEDAWNNMAIALEKQGDWASAIKAYRKQVEVKPDHEYARDNLIIALEKQRDWASAIEAYRELLKVKPDHEDAWNNMAGVLEEQGNLTAAIEAYRKQVEVKPDHEDAWNNMAGVLEEQGNLTAAIEAYRKQLEVEPDHECAWNNLARVLEKQDNLEDAIKTYREGISRESTRGQCHNGLAWSYYLRGESLTEAEALAREAVAIDPEVLDYRNTLATLLLCNGKWPEAKTEARLFLKLVDEHLLESTWSSLQFFFREVVTKGYAQEVVELLQETGAAERWRPLYTALKAVVEGEDQFTRVAPEVSEIAKELFEQITGVT